jgi:hypothetical protein
MVSRLVVQVRKPATERTYSESYTHCGFQRTPLSWIDGASDHIEAQYRLPPCDSNGTSAPFGVERPTPPQLHGIFIWNAQLGHQADTCVSDSSQAVPMQVVRARIEEALEIGLDMEGRDLFPGPGYGR